MNRIEHQNLFAQYPDMVSVAVMRNMCGDICKKVAYEAIHSRKMKHIKSGHSYYVSKDDIVDFLYERDCLQEANDPFILHMRNFYEALYKNYPDIVNSFQLEEMLGYGRSAILKWLQTGLVKSYWCNEAYKIKKEEAILFVLSPYYRQIRRKSKLHQEWLSTLAKTFPDN